MKHYFSLSCTTFHYYALLFIIVYYFSLLCTIVIIMHYFSLLCTTFHSYALFFIIMHYFSLLCFTFHSFYFTNTLYHRKPFISPSTRDKHSQSSTSPPSQVQSVTMEDEIGELMRLIVSKLEELILSLTLGPDSADSVTINEL